MVVASTRSVWSEKSPHIELPVIDLSDERSRVSKQIVKASEEFGFFKVINHGVPKDVITRMEEEGFEFFEKPFYVKQKAGPADPYGYGCKNIGFNGDKGELEYLLLHTNPLSISERSKNISSEPMKFGYVVSGYVEAVRELACEILELMAEGLNVNDTSVFSSLISDVDHTDSLLRLNYYPPLTPPPPPHHHLTSNIGFGEHTDPQILTLLRSNDVGGLQISTRDGVWVPVTPHPTAFFVNVGDMLQAMTNGRLLSVKHRVMVNSYMPRMSMAYFAAPPVEGRISPLPELVTPPQQLLYRSFTWSEYKNAAYSKRLGDTRLDHFLLHQN